jgi:hypothetical protein
LRGEAGGSLIVEANIHIMLKKIKIHFRFIDKRRGKKRRKWQPF